MSRTRFRAFTLIEMLIVVGIILFLMTLTFCSARYWMKRSAIVSTQSTISKLHTVLIAYQVNHRDFPAGAPDADTWPSPYATTGVPLDKSLVFIDSANADFKTSEFDKTGTVFVDAWGNPIRYRKLSRDHILLWSTGLNAKDEIGTGQIWDAATQAYTPGPSGGNFEAMGDDIPMNKMD